MKGKFTLKPCPHCGGEATLASPDQWSYLSCIVFCPSCLAKGPQGYDYAKAIGGWMYRLGTQKKKGQAERRAKSAKDWRCNPSTQ